MKCITRNFTRGGEMIGRALIIPILYYNTKCQKFKIPVGGGGGGGNKSGGYLGIPPLCIKLL